MPYDLARRASIVVLLLVAPNVAEEQTCIAEEGSDDCAAITSSSFIQTKAKTKKSISDASAKTQQYPHDLMPCPGATAPLRTVNMTEARYDAVVASVAATLQQLSDSCDAVSCERADFMGCVLRLAGHDFMDFDPGTQTGGSDGCTSMAHPDNAGLPACLHAGELGVSLLPPYQEHCGDVSLADFLVIAAEAVMSHSRVMAGRTPVDFKSGFRYGRETSVACPGAASRLPDPDRGCAAVEENFVAAMGLSWTGAAALMGVHTMGRARIENSGFHGWWSDPANSRIFNNDYYVSLMSKGWRPETSVSGTTVRSQWGRSDRARDTSFPGHEMMLNTDMCLAYAHEGAPVSSFAHDCCAWVTFGTGGASCGNRGQCCGQQAQDCGDRRNPTGPAAQDVLRFGNSEADWLGEFLAAWAQVTGNGFPDLHALELTSTPAPTSAPTSTPSPPMGGGGGGGRRRGSRRGGKGR